jgi:DNA-binding MarR family transcriptional regulator
MKWGVDLSWRPRYLLSSYSVARKSKIDAVRKVSQQYAYLSLQLHETIARKAGFTGTDHKYLVFFLQKGSLTAGELATLAGLTTGSVTGLIDRFEKKKLVKSFANATFE